MKKYYVYILASRRNGTLYIGITSDLVRRIWEHRNKSNLGFTSIYNVNQLVYFEEFDDVGFAIHREKRLKKWPRKSKLKPIKSVNPEWKDLYFEIAE